MSGSIRMPTEQEVDRLRNVDDRSCDRLFGDKLGSTVLSPALLISAAIIAILFVANVIPPDIAAAVGLTLGGVGILFLPLVIANVYQFYAYRNKPIKTDRFKSKLGNAIQMYEGKNNLDKVKELKELASKYNIDLDLEKK